MEHLNAVWRIWQARHGLDPVPAFRVHPDVRRLIDRQGRGRQYVAAWLASHGRELLKRELDALPPGYHLLRQRPVGRWGRSTYQLRHIQAGGRS
jgi:hypothetical protein